ncbi:hypothetical protein M1116_03075 [Patescibacteria group bacterium]|nr:hypothetical protein [Patescibacteria group bacterium]
MFKNLIAPVQVWLLSQKRCVGCGTSLSLGSSKKVKSLETITCRCGRIFVHDPAKDSYRRALIEEIK